MRSLGFHCELVWVPSLHHLHEACVLHLMHEVPWFLCELVWFPSLHHLHEACESRLMHEVPWFPL